MIKSIIKRDGRVVLYDQGKIAAAILRALPRVDLDTAKMIVSMLHRFVSIGAQNVAELVRQRSVGDPTNDSAKGEFLP